MLARPPLSTPCRCSAASHVYTVLPSSFSPLVYGRSTLSLLCIELDKTTQTRMKAVMEELGFKTKASFITHCIKIALKTHHFDADLGLLSYARTQDTSLSKERILYAESSTLPQTAFSESKVDVKNDSKKAPLQFLPPNWQPPEHLRHKY